MSDRLTHLLFGLFVAATALQIGLFVARAHGPARIPVVLPYRLEDLHIPGSPRPEPRPPEAPPSSSPTPTRDGPSMTTDDLVRGLLALCKQTDPSLGLTSEQRRRLIPLVREAAARKERLHQLRKQEETLQQALAEKGVRILQTLTPQQLDALLSNRDETERLLRNLPDLRARLAPQAAPSAAPQAPVPHP